MQPSSSPCQQNSKAGLRGDDTASFIDELILSGPGPGRFLRSVLNELANEQDERWLTLILSDKDTINWLKSSGISRHRLLVLNSSVQTDSLQLTCKALASGTSHTVVSWINSLDSSALSELESAARSGQCQGLAVRNREINQEYCANV